MLETSYPLSLSFFSWVEQDSRDVCDDRDVVSNGDSRFILLTLCTNNLSLPQFMHLHFTVQTIVFFAYVQRMFWIQLVWFCFVWVGVFTTPYSQVNVTATWKKKKKIHIPSIKIDQTINNEHAFQCGEPFE